MLTSIAISGVKRGFERLNWHDGQSNDAREHRAEISVSPSKERFVIINLQEIKVSISGIVLFLYQFKDDIYSV